MKCVELALAFVRRGWSKSASKLDTLQTLRAIWLRSCRSVLSLRHAVGSRHEFSLQAGEGIRPQIENLRYSRLQICATLNTFANRAMRLILTIVPRLASWLN